jgi:hypothetical protein
MAAWLPTARAHQPERILAGRLVMNIRTTAALSESELRGCDPLRRLTSNAIGGGARKELDQAAVDLNLPC